MTFCVRLPNSQYNSHVESIYKEPRSAGEFECPTCGSINETKDRFCYSCRAGFNPADLRRAPGALASLLWSTLGVLVLGFIASIFAIRQSKNARELIETDPTYTGMGMARTGQIVGWIELVLGIIGLISLIFGRRR